MFVIFSNCSTKQYMSKLCCYKYQHTHMNVLFTCLNETSNVKQQKLRQLSIPANTHTVHTALDVIFRHSSQTYTRCLQRCYICIEFSTVPFLGLNPFLVDDRMRRSSHGRVTTLLADFSCIGAFTAKLRQPRETTPTCFHSLFSFMLSALLLLTSQHLFLHYFFVLTCLYSQLKMSSKANGEQDDDCLFLEHVLDKLYDFGKWSEEASRLAYRP